MESVDIAVDVETGLIEASKEEDGYLVIQNKSVDGRLVEADVSQNNKNTLELAELEITESKSVTVNNKHKISIISEETPAVILHDKHDENVDGAIDEKTNFLHDNKFKDEDSSYEAVLSDVCSAASSDPSDTSDDSSLNSRVESDGPQDLRLKPKKITLCFDLKDSSSESSGSSIVDNSDIEGIPRKRRLQRTTNSDSSQDKTFDSSHFVEISSEESLSSFEAGSSAIEFKMSNISQQSNSSGFSSKRSTDIESGGIKDSRRSTLKKGVAGFVSLLGLGRFWFNSSKSSRFDEAAEKRKLAEAEKNKTTVAEIYPWITEEEKRVLRETKDKFKHRAGILPISEDIEIIRQC